MRYRQLGSAGIAVSKIALGTMYFGDETGQDNAFAILDAFLEAGGNHINTADVYADSKSEQIIGAWLASRPKDVTDRVILATKGRVATSPDVNDAGLSRRHLHRALDASLQRLQVETIDLYQMHASDLHTSMVETISFLADAVRAGKVHYYGLSNFLGWELQLFVSTAKAMGAPLPATLQPQYSLLSREIEHEIVPAAIHNGLGLLPWSPLAGGLLAGKYQRSGSPEGDTRAGSQKPLYQWTMEEYAESDQNWVTIEEVKRIASEIGATSAQVALSWIGDRPGVTAPIAGARTLEHLKSNLVAADLELDEAATSALAKVSEPRSNGYPYGAFGAWQRGRDLKDGAPVAPSPFTGGSSTPLGKD